MLNSLGGFHENIAFLMLCHCHHYDKCALVTLTNDSTYSPDPNRSKHCHILIFDISPFRRYQHERKCEKACLCSRKVHLWTHSHRLEVIFLFFFWLLPSGVVTADHFLYIHQSYLPLPIFELKLLLSHKENLTVFISSTSSSASRLLDVAALQPTHHSTSRPSL